jgi:hypothetical protein
MVVPVSLEDSELEELYALPDDTPEDSLVARKLAVKGHLHELAAFADFSVYSNVAEYGGAK